MGTNKELQSAVRKLEQQYRWLWRTRKQAERAQSNIDDLLAQLVWLGVDSDDLERVRAQAEQAAWRATIDDQTTD
jgi:hypothetical protein